jgi:hypothetical protein
MSIALNVTRPHITHHSCPLQRSIPPFIIKLQSTFQPYDKRCGRHLATIKLASRQQQFDSLRVCFDSPCLHRRTELDVHCKYKPLGITFSSLQKLLNAKFLERRSATSHLLAITLRIYERRITQPSHFFTNTSEPHWEQPPVYST